MTMTTKTTTATTTTTTATATSQVTVERGQVIVDNSVADNAKDAGQQQSLQQSIHHPQPQHFHHPHIPVSHVASLYKPQPYFSPTSSSSSHQQHHSQPKINVPTLTNSGGNGGTSVISTNCNTKQNSHHTADGSSQAVSVIMSQRSEASLMSPPNAVNCIVSNEKTTSSSNHNGGNSQTLINGNKMVNHANSHYNKSSADTSPIKEAKLNSCVSEKIEARQNQPNQMEQNNHVGKNSVQDIAGKGAPTPPPSVYEEQENGSEPDEEIIIPEKEAMIPEPETEIHESEINKIQQQSDQNVLSTLSFQPSFKFNINDITPKPIDTNQLMQSIQSEEVLRTCQNVSNVLLQIPKYQEKLLNFSNELKTAFCFTDKCNNLTEISVRCEPAVLNVPDLSKALVKEQDATSDKIFLVPENPRTLTSSLDLAEKRRKRKRAKNAGGLVCSSESEGEEEIKDADLWITKGPPARPRYSEKKLAFLAMFGLTTLSMKNEIELFKVERRYKLNPDPPEVPLDMDQSVESVLPIPQEHPDVLRYTPDFQPKVGFLKSIGLDLLPQKKRDEAEATWQYVLQDRKKRKSRNTVTAYCERMAKVYSRNPPKAPKPPKMRLLGKLKVKQLPERPPPMPPLVQNIVSMDFSSLSPMPGENGVKQQQRCKLLDIKILDEDVALTVSDGRKETSKWTSIEDIMLAYREYSKEKALEKKILMCETSKLVARSNNLRTETLQLERRIYDLLSAKSALDLERRVLSEKIERITALVKHLR